MPDTIPASDDSFDAGVGETVRRRARRAPASTPPTEFDPSDASPMRGTVPGGAGKLPDGIDPIKLVDRASVDTEFVVRTVAPTGTPTPAVPSTAESRLMAEAFHQIIHFDEAKQYDKRNSNVLLCMHYAQRLGYPVGIRFDPDAGPAWPVVYIELPTGQVSWHIAEHFKAWDGHDTTAKYERCMAYSKAVYGA